MKQKLRKKNLQKIPIEQCMQHAGYVPTSSKHCSSIIHIQCKVSIMVSKLVSMKVSQYTNFVSFIINQLMPI